jgi:hypothetical protein
MTTTDTPIALKPTGYECKFATYVEAQDGSENDLLVVKEYAHMPDGTTVPNLRLIHNYKRPFWVTRPGNRNHEDKKEWEDLNKLQKFESTQVALGKNIARALGRAPTAKGDLRMLMRNQYLYGCDISTPTLAKRRYMDQWPTAISHNLVAALDSETDMIRGHEEIIMLSLTQRDKIKLVVVEEFMEGVADPIGSIHAAFEKYLGDASSDLGDLIRKRNLKLDVELVKNAGECAHRIIQTAHEWQPDIISIWNINFDLPKMIKALEKYGFDLAATFSDPRVPDPFKYFKYKEGKAQKVTASGKSMALHPAEQWHTVFTPASFYFLDSMCVYLKLRIAKGKEASYSLDYILNKHLGIRKLKFKEADHLQGPNWHVFMQKNYKAEYCIYNIFDSISLEMLDEKITDLRQMISSMCEHSEFHRFPSQPRRTCDDLHFFALENGKVAATTSDKMEDELDQFVVPLTDWIVTLPSHMVFDDGLKVIEELPKVSTLMRAHVADLDVEGTYPNVEIIANISKETTSKELSQIRGVELPVQRAIGIHLSGGHVNAVEICQNVYKAPSFDTMLEAFRKKKGIAEIPPPMVEALKIEQQQAMTGPDPLSEVPAEVAMVSEPEVVTTPVSAEVVANISSLVAHVQTEVVPTEDPNVYLVSAENAQAADLLDKLDTLVNEHCHDVEFLRQLRSHPAWAKLNMPETVDV